MSDVQQQEARPNEPTPGEPMPAAAIAPEPSTLNLSDPVASSDRKRLGDVAPSPWYDRDPHIIGNAISPQLLSQILRDRNLGYLRDWVDFCNEMRRNSPHLHSQLAIREESVVETEFAIEPGDSSPKAKRAADLCTELWKHWRKRGLLEWIAQLTAAAYYGRSAHELVWRRDGALTVVESLDHIDERRLSLACDVTDPDPWAMRLWDRETADMPQYGYKIAQHFGEDKVLVHAPRVLGGPKTAEGLASVVVWYVVFGIWTWRDLMALSELIGQQPVVGVYAAGGAKAATQQDFAGPQQATAEQIAKLQRAVFGMAGALRAVLPDTTRIELPKFQLPTGEPIQLLTEKRANELISKAVNGVANLSDLQPGARAAVESQERTSFTFWRSDCRRTAMQFERVFEWICMANPDALGTVSPIVRPLLESKPATVSAKPGTEKTTDGEKGDPEGDEPPAPPQEGGAP